MKDVSVVELSIPNVDELGIFRGGMRNVEVTAFDIFTAEYKLDLLTVKVRCPKCGHIWGIKVDDYMDTHEIPDRKFKCTECDI